jgi:hypothetical protein
MYSLVFVESRYVAPFLVTLGMSIFAAVSGNVGQRRLRVLAISTAAVVCFAFTARDTALNLGFVAFRIINRGEGFWDAQWRTAQEMKQYGIKPGAKIGYIGLPINAYWIRLSRARVICEVPVLALRNTDLANTLAVGAQEAEAFWSSPAADRRRLLDAMHQSGAQAVIAEKAPEWALQDGWRELKTRIAKRYGDDRTFIYVFKDERRPVTPAPPLSPPPPHTPRAS